MVAEKFELKKPEESNNSKPIGMDTMDLKDVQESLDNKDGDRPRSLMRNYPKGVFFCLGNEFAERFSFYGMRAILTLYLISVHDMDDHQAKLIFHAFVTLVYFTPIFGSILADGFLGRYRVILYISILYCLGHVLLTLGAIPNLGSEVLKVLDYIGLFVIAVAAGGIKPCVSAFAADQFPETMAKERKQFFSFFYFSINLGALLSKIVTPYLRGRVHCLGEDSCFPLAFGVPAVVMFMALIVFVCGKPFYKIAKCEDNVILKVCKCCFHAITSCVRSPKWSWLDYAVPKYDKRFVEDIRSLSSIIILFLPVIPFWALFDQMGSTWVLQANRMDGRLGSLTVLPDQMSVLNPCLVILLVPVFEMAIYPLLGKMNLLTKPLQRMSVGGILAALSFVVAGFLQFGINKTMIEMPSVHQTHVVISNRNPLCTLDINSDKENFTVNANSDVSSNIMGIAFNVSDTCSGVEKQFKFERGNLKDAGHLLVFWNSNLEYTTKNFELKKTRGGKSRIYIMRAVEADIGNRTVKVLQGALIKAQEKVNSSFVDIEPELICSNEYEIVQETCEYQGCKLSEQYKFTAQMGGAHAILFSANNTSPSLVELIPPNSISLMWQVPQYIVITVGEILLSISGLEFSYSQAPPSMKSVLQAIWLMTTAFGNVIDMIISGSSLIEDAAIEFFVYAVLMFVVMGVFIIFAMRYKYNEHHGEETDKNVIPESSTEKSKL